MIGQFPRRLLTADETVLEEFHPHWRIMLPSIGLGAVACVASLLFFTTGAPEWTRYVLWALWALVVVVAASEWVRRVSTVYVLTDQRLVWRWGVLRRSGIEFPLEQINTVSFSQDLIERALGFGDLEIESASANGTSRFDNIPDPQGFQSKIYSARNALSRRDAPTVPQNPNRAEANLDALERLGDLYERGLLNDDEFTAAKQDLLADGHG